MDPSQLSRWTRFAKKGGIGKCLALQDCVAESPGDLMFLKVLPLSILSAISLKKNEQDDEITVLMQIPDEEGIYLVCLLLTTPVFVHSSLLRTSDRATAKASLVASQPLMFSSLASSRHPSFQSALPPPPSHRVRAL